MGKCAQTFFKPKLTRAIASSRVFLAGCIGLTWSSVDAIIFCFYPRHSPPTHGLGWRKPQAQSLTSPEQLFFSRLFFPPLPAPFIKKKGCNETLIRSSSFTPISAGYPRVESGHTIRARVPWAFVVYRGLRRVSGPSYLHGGVAAAESSCPPLIARIASSLP